MRFLGNIEAKTDAKGRVFFPSAMRKVLQSAGEELLVMRKDVHQACLVLYPESVWNQQMDEARQKLNRWDAQEQLLFRQFVMNVEFISLDGNGRFLIPKRYLQMAGIEQSVHFIGMGDCIEIWASQHLEAPFIEAEEFGRLFGERMSAPANTNLSNSDTPW